MLLGVIGDDFTGSVDALLNARRQGLSATLVTEPSAIDDADADVVVFAGTFRAMPTPELVEAVGPILERFCSSGAQFVQYKACSTGDSAPEVGSLGAVIELARARVGSAPIPVLLAQPDFGRFTVFSTHFARDGEVVHRLDRHPTMSEHPVTPMREADLRRHLAEQTSLQIGAFTVADFDGGQAIAAASLEHGAPVIVIDALTTEHVLQFGEWFVAAGVAQSATSARFAVGSGALTAGLCAALRSSSSSPDAPLSRVAPATSGPVVTLSGSASPLTARQLAASGWPILPVDDPATSQAAIDALTRGTSVAITVTGPGQLDGLAEIARRVVSFADRVVICGGDSSGKLLLDLGVSRLEIIAQPWGNLPLLRTTGTGSALDGAHLVLKGGQMGDDDVLTRIAADGLTTFDQEHSS